MKANIPALGLAAAGLAACGGGLLAVLQIVTPLGGDWRSGGTSITFTNVDATTQAYLTKFEVLATISTNEIAAGVCGASQGDSKSLVGTVDNGSLVMRRLDLMNAPVCIEGTFSDLRKLDTIALGNLSARSYTNDIVDVQMQEGIWVGESGTLRLKFNGPESVLNDGARAATGCNVSNPQAKVNFEGEMLGFNTTTLRRPFIQTLTGAGGNPTYFTQVEFVDGATIRLLNATGQLVTLKRQPNPNNLTC